MEDTPCHSDPYCVGRPTTYSRMHEVTPTARSRRTFRLGARDRKSVTALLTRVAHHGPPRNQEKSRKIAGEDFWEFKARQQRVFWCYTPGRRIVLLHGFTKKTRKAPTHAVEVARHTYREAQEELRQA